MNDKKDVFRIARFSLFLVYLWFGFLKIIFVSSANDLVLQLLHVTFLQHFVSDHTFLIIFGLFEMLIGVLALFPSLTRWMFGLIILHLATTFLPFILLPDVVWKGFLTPTLIGQYIIKNFLLFSLAYMLFSFNEQKNTTTK